VDTITTRELFDGLVAGAVASSAGVVAYTARRGARDALPYGGLLFAAGGLAALAWWRDVPVPLVVGLLGIAGTTALVARARLPLWSAAVAVAPFAWLVAEHARLPPVGWLRVVVIALICVIGPVVAGGDTATKSMALGPALLAVTIAGIYVCTPDTEEVRTLLGVAIVLATLSWPLRWLRLGSAGSVAAVATVAWAAAIDARGHPVTLLGAVGCIGALAISLFVASARPRQRPAMRAPIIIAMHIALVVIAVGATRTLTSSPRAQKSSRAVVAQATRASSNSRPRCAFQ